MDTQGVDQRVAELFKDVTPALEQTGQQVRKVVQEVLREHQNIFPEWIKVTSMSSSPGWSGALHAEVELHTPSCTLWTILRRYDGLEDFDPQNVFSSESPRVVVYEQPREEGRRELSVISWVDYRYRVLAALLSLEKKGKTKVG